MTNAENTKAARSCVRSIISYCLGILTLSALVSCLSAGQITQRAGSTWVSLHGTGKIYRIGGYETWETFDRKTYTRRVFLRKPVEKKAKLIYTHGRGISLTVGHKGQLVLVNDYFATKACKVATVDIDTGRAREIDSAAVKWYTERANPDPRLIIVPEAQGFSPDDRQVLIQMELIYVSIPTAEEAGNVGKTFKPRGYAVDSVSGQVLHEFRARRFPKDWWKSETKQGAAVPK